MMSDDGRHRLLGWSPEENPGPRTQDPVLQVVDQSLPSRHIVGEYFPSDVQKQGIMECVNSTQNIQNLQENNMLHFHVRRILWFYDWPGCASEELLIIPQQVTTSQTMAFNGAIPLPPRARKIVLRFTSTVFDVITAHALISAHPSLWEKFLKKIKV